MKQLVKLFPLLLLFASCSTEEDTKSTENEFQAYLETLDKIDLPLTINPLGELPRISRHYDKNGFDKFKHSWTSQPFGILFQNDKTVGLIDCSAGDLGLVPFLTIYDLKGNKIDSTNFYEKSGQDAGYEAIEYLTFSENKIVMKDTVKTWDIEDELGEQKKEVSTEETHFKISPSGTIQKAVTKK